MRSSCSHNLRSPRAKRYVRVYQNWVKQLVVVVFAATATWPTLCHKLCLTFLFNENESRSLAIQEYKLTCHVGLKDFRLMIVKVKLKLKQWKTVENWENLQLPKHKQVARPHRAHTPLASLRQICLLCFAFIIRYIKWSCCGLVSVLPPRANWESGRDSNLSRESFVNIQSNKQPRKKMLNKCCKNTRAAVAVLSGHLTGLASVD